MHSILESDGVSSDPAEVLCHMGTLIVEGRTPKTIGDLSALSEMGAKSGKPYNEGPHCPNFMKLYNKDTHNVHKCTENNMLCIRYNNLRQSLQSLHLKSPTVCIEVSLGPDCLCGELRSQSTLVSNQPSKRDIVLEQWTITIGHKQMQEPSSQMSVMNLYQAVRSLLHFSQLTAWYMCNKGMKPAHVIYRIGVPEDSTFISDDNFVNHDFPVADVNKTVWMKISVKTRPRMEKIPSVFCLQHPTAMVDVTQSSHFEGKEPQKLSKEKSFSNPEPLHSKFSAENKEELLESKLPLKFQGVRKKTFEAQERKRKKHITLFDAPSSLKMDGCPGGEFFDGMPVDVKKMYHDEDAEYFCSERIQKELLKSCLGESSKTEYKKSKSGAFSTDLSDLVKPQRDLEMFDTFSCNYFEQDVVDPTLDLLIGLKIYSDFKGKSDFRTKGKIKNNCGSPESTSESVSKKVESETIMDILDDRMQISCAISGKHHCKWECEEDSDVNNPGENVEKPKRRRSLSKVRVTECCEDVKLGGSDSEKILHGKFKEIDCCKSDLCSLLRECKADEPIAETKPFIDFPERSHSPRNYSLESPPKVMSSVKKCSVESYVQPQTPKIESLPRKEAIKIEKPGVSELAANEKHEKSSQGKTSLGGSRTLNWVRTESLESFKRGCAFAWDSAAECSSDSEAESSDGHETANPFLAAILRTTKKSRTSRNLIKCDSSLTNKLVGNGVEEPKGKTGLLLDKLKDPIKCYVNEKISDLKAKVDVSEEVQSRSPAQEKNACCNSFKGRGKNSDLRLSKKKSSAIRSCRDFNEEGPSSSSEFLSKNLNILKSFFEVQDLKRTGNPPDAGENLSDETQSNNSNSTKTIPVPSAHDKLKFRRSLDSAAQLVFHRCSGLPLTSSPAPVRRNNNSFSFDSSLNSVSAIKSALFEPSNSLSSEDENESEGSLKSPASPGAWSVGSKLINYHSLSPLPLLGSFEESVLNGRLEPVSTVQGFTAELGASGSFCPRHLYLPVTVFFYTLGDNDKVSAPYLGHINLGKKGYSVPRSGTIQVTLFNPMRTVVKMFVVVYDLHDMPPNSHTFLRQRTLYVPASQKESTYTDKKEIPFDQEDYHRYLRYLIHLRFVSGKTGKIYLHTDIRMVIFRKADEDTATALGNQCVGEAYELRSHTHGPINPKFSPRK